MSDFCFASIREIHNAYREKRLSVRSLVLSFLSRIKEFDKCTDGLNSVLELNPDALFIADKFDQSLNEGSEFGQDGKFPSLFGIPVLLKDNINTADRLHTSAGSLSLADNYAPYDARIAGRLREAGAIILGKANMTEFANYMSREGMPSGYSSRGGQVLNPYNRSITPSGSSSGSAVAVAAGLCTVSIGTETSGSILSPASHNGIVGIKPTLGLVGRSGIIPISGTHDTAGPMARSAEDAAVLLGVIAGFDPNDAVTNPEPQADYASCLDPAALAGFKIGINRSQKGKEEDFYEEHKKNFDHLCAVLAEAGAVLIDNVDIDPSPGIGKIMRNEFKACMNYYLSSLRGSTRMKSLKDIIEFNQANAQTALKYGQSILLEAENKTSGLLTEPEYLEALAEREKAVTAFDKLFIDNGIEILLCENFSNIAPYTGFPAMTIPIGQRQDKLPVGSYWIARRFGEAKLLKAAYAAERLLGLTLKPELDSQE